jgi:hypothetical protein
MWPSQSISSMPKTLESDPRLKLSMGMGFDYWNTGAAGTVPFRGMFAGQFSRF